MSNSPPSPGLSSDQNKNDDKLEVDLVAEVELQQRSKAASILKNVTDVVPGFILMLNTWGVANSFGLFQTFYESELLRGESESNIAWIGSIQIFLLLFSGLWIGPIYDSGHGRKVVVFGTFMVSFGLMITSLCTAYWQVILSQGLCIGIGFGCLLTPALTTTIEHFPNRTAIAVGIATSGGSIGGVIYPIVFRSIQPSLAFPWTTRVLGFIVLGTQCIALALIRTKARSSKRRPIFDTSMIHNIPYSLFTLSLIFGFMGLYTPFFFIQTYSASIYVNSNLAFFTLVIMNASSTAGRILPNLVAHILGPINTAIITTAVCSILSFVWIVIEDTPALIVWCILYGFFSGTYVAITAPAISSTTTNADLRGTHLGMAFGFAALGILIGNPIAGVLLSSVGWIALQCFAASVCMLAVILMVAARVAGTGFDLFAQA